MKFLSQLDDLIKKAVNETFAGEERKRQDMQATKIDSLGLHAKKKQQKTEPKEEADDEGDEEKKKDEPKKTEKIKGDPKKSLSAEEKPAEKEKEKEKPGTQTSKKLQDPSAKELSQPDFKSIAKNINLLRGGKSLKDEEVRKNLKDYIQKLSSDEKKNVLIYLNSLAQVMAGVKSGSEALEPTDAPQKSEPSKKISQTKEKTTSSAETSGSGVIVVGR